MNWLAHAFLSEENIYCQLGNILADPLKGKSWETADVNLVKGMDLHKKIDAFTDSHTVVKKSKSRFVGKTYLKGVVVDIVYDYYLTKHWDRFSTVPREDFLDTFYSACAEVSPSFPDGAKKFANSLFQSERLSKYSSLAEVKTAFQRIDSRLSERILKKESATSYFDLVLSLERELEEDFLEFFPELMSYTQQFVNLDSIQHWKL